MNNAHEHVPVILPTGFMACNICGYYILFECPSCYCLLKFKGENHHCPDRGVEEDEGIDHDEVNQSECWDNIDCKKCYIYHQS